MRYACLLFGLLACAHEPPVSAPPTVTSAELRDAVGERLDRAANAMLAFRHEVPASEAAQTRCAAIFPDVHFLGADGFITCRTKSAWSAPEPVAIEKPGQDGVDLLVLVTSERQLATFERSGIVADRDVMAYARAGDRIVPVDVSGAMIDVVSGTQRALYGKMRRPEEVLGGFVAPPTAAMPLLHSTDVVLPIQ
jgi:lipid-binding SYLF domain-containing protein